MLGPAFIYFAFWYMLGVLAFWLIGLETQGRTIEEIDSSLDRPVRGSTGGATRRQLDLRLGTPP